MKAAVPLVVLAVLMAGCTSLEIPDHASVDMHDETPDGMLYGWVEPEDNFTRIVGHFDYDGTDLFRVNWVQPHGYWNLTILNDEGSEIIYDERPARKDFDELLQGPFAETFYFTWLHNEYDRYQRAGTYDEIPQHPVEPGTYTAILGFNVWGVPDDAFQVSFPVVVFEN